MDLLRSSLWLFMRLFLWLRYRVRIHGLEKLKPLKGPVLLLPSHPAFVDPPIVMSHLHPYLHPRPLLFEGNFANPVMYPLMVMMNPIRVPELGQASADARERTNKAIDEVKAALKAGDNVVLWPSGKLERAGIEKLGAARTLSDVLKAVPEAEVVLARTRGLWGSRFSYGFDGHSPPFISRVLQGLGWLLLNLIFFAPRRKVEIHLEHVPRGDLPALDRETLNPFLEEKYHPGGVPETPTFVPVHFLASDSYDFPSCSQADDLDLSALKPETKQAVDEMLAAKLSRSVEGLKPETHLDALGLDSLDRMELSLAVERRFGFHGDQVPVTLGQLYALAGGLARREPPKPAPPLWFKPPRGSLQPEILADTVARAFVERALRSRDDVAVADDRSGVLTYEKLLVGSLVLSRRIKELPGEAVGVLLPASVGCDVCLYGTYLGGKLPVVLNWTTGQANLAHAAQVMKLQRVLTSRAVIDRLGITVPGAEFVFLEDLGKGISTWEKLATLLAVRWFPSSIRKQVPTPDPDSPAVVLFTSGSEKAPKAVPLTHRNLLTNQRDAIAFFGVDRRHSWLGFLPAFHSFGMSITGLYPVLAGFRVVRHPDPTDAAALARKVGSYKTTILVGTPTFVSYILERAEPGELASLELVVVGAEKCPQAVFDRMAVAAPKAQILEGYGITECSPTVSANPPGKSKPGTVGKPFANVKLKVVDLETEQEVPQGTMGMLLVGGPTIFPGYAGHDVPSPFREMNGEKWYVTGDLVEIDSEGYIRFSGRLKRFIKSGGEMISLPALEEPFSRLYPPTKDGPRVAVEGVETEGGGRRVVLFATEPISLREANELLLKEGFQGVMRLDEVRKVDSLPVLGTGKTDYKVLRAQIA